MNKSESKYFNTALLMDKALIELLGKKDISYISVKELCLKAGVNRSTFYLHYETIADLLEETMEYIDNQFNKSFENSQEHFTRHIDEIPLSELVLINHTYLEPYLKFVYDNRAVYRAAINNPATMKTDKRYMNLKKHIIEPIMARFEIPDDVRNYWTAYYISGIWAVIQEWINRGCREPIERIICIIEDCVRPDNALHNKRVGE